MKGKLKHWNKGKGFGFIAVKQEAQDIFIHISALKKMARPPVVGDIINFEIYTDNNGKKRAINAEIEGVSKKVKLKKYDKSNNNIWLSGIIAIFIVAGIYIFYLNFINDTSSSFSNTSKPLFVKQSVEKPRKPKVIKSKYHCEAGKEYCSQMRSCEEAKFYINNCPNTKMDGDRDGIPCESQWCRT